MKTNKEINDDFDKKFYFLVDNNDKHKETEVKTEISHIRNQDLESLREWIEKARIEILPTHAEENGYECALDDFITHLNSLSEDNK